jgi:hypothetical protein
VENASSHNTRVHHYVNVIQVLSISHFATIVTRQNFYWNIWRSFALGHIKWRRKNLPGEGHGGLYANNDPMGGPKTPRPKGERSLRSVLAPASPLPTSDLLPTASNHHHVLQNFCYYLTKQALAFAAHQAYLLSVINY